MKTPFKLIWAVALCLLACCDQRAKEDAAVARQEASQLSKTNEAFSKDIVSLKAKVATLESALQDAENCRSNFANLNDRITALENELERTKQATTADKRLRIRAQKDNFYLALSIARTVREDGKSTRLEEAGNAVLVALEHDLGKKTERLSDYTFPKWMRIYDDKKERVWELTKVLVENGSFVELSKSIRAFYAGLEKYFCSSELPLEDALVKQELELKALKAKVDAIATVE